MTQESRSFPIDMENWDRIEQFNYFKDFTDPYFGFSADCDITELKRLCKDRGYSFFAAYLFASQQVVNSIPEMRYRLSGEQVIEYESVCAGSTVLKQNKVFTFCSFDHYSDFQAFQDHVVERVSECEGPEKKLQSREGRLDQIFYSVIPWIHFTALIHPRNHAAETSIPQIVFGKIVEKNDRVIMPISVEAHHGLMDGIHLGLYYEQIQNYFAHPESLIER